MRSETSGSVCEVELLPEAGIVRKRVRRLEQGVENGHDKLLYEAEYMREVEGHERWFPRVIDMRYEGDELVVETEYLFDGRSLADLMFDAGVSDQYVLGGLDYVVRRLFSEFYVRTDSRIARDYWSVCYLDRTRRRIRRSVELAEGDGGWDLLLRCLGEGMKINGIRYASAAEYLDLITRGVDLEASFPLGGTYRTHHDLIPENIMVDCRLEGVRDFRLIDPRGVAETGERYRHFVYDAGKLMFGLDSYGLFRRHYGTNELFSFNADERGEFELTYDGESGIVQRLRVLRNAFREAFQREAARLDPAIADPWRYLLLSYAFMYIPDVPCRMRDEGDQELALLFYARGLMVLHALAVELFGEDRLSSDRYGRVLVL